LSAKQFAGAACCCDLYNVLQVRFSVDWLTHI
jgi:hypothetical protein